MGGFPAVTRIGQITNPMNSVGLERSWTCYAFRYPGLSRQTSDCAYAHQFPSMQISNGPVYRWFSKVDHLANPDHRGREWNKQPPRIAHHRTSAGVPLTGSRCTNRLRRCVRPTPLMPLYENGIGMWRRATPSSAVVAAPVGVSISTDWNRYSTGGPSGLSTGRWPSAGQSVASPDRNSVRPPAPCVLQRRRPQAQFIISETVINRLATSYLL